MIGEIALKIPGRGIGKRRRFVFSDRNRFYHTMSRVAICFWGEIEKEAKFQSLIRA